MPDKHEVGGSSPLGPTIVASATNVFIENRIKRNETDSCKGFLKKMRNHREKLVRQITYRFFRTIVWRKNNEELFY